MAVYAVWAPGTEEGITDGIILVTMFEQFKSGNSYGIYCSWLQESN